MDSCYKKHQLFYRCYKDWESGSVRLPELCSWRVMNHLEGGHFIEPENGEGDICLILYENRGESSGFWPVMSFLSSEEALALSERLREAAEAKQNLSDGEQ